tara:strand:+ start:996 stop:1481 length:486 start_codon:yes stop_codon:yes gene_type:complete
MSPNNRVDSWSSPGEEITQILAGPKVTSHSWTAESVLSGTLTAKAVNTVGVIRLQNPYDHERLITKVVLYITTAGASSATMDVDVVGSSSATGDDIFDGVVLSAAARKDSGTTDAGTNGEKRPWVWDEKDGTNDWLTGKTLVNGATALVGYYHVYSIPSLP